MILHQEPLNEYRIESGELEEFYPIFVNYWNKIYIKTDIFFHRF